MGKALSNDVMVLLWAEVGPYDLQRPFLTEIEVIIFEVIEWEQNPEHQKS